MSYVDSSGAPLSEPVLLILMSLAELPRHGYAILQDVQELSSGRVRLSTGTLYGALQRMLDDGWIVRQVEEDAPRGRRAYRLAAAGREILEAEVARMNALAGIAAARLAEGGTDDSGNLPDAPAALPG